MPKKGSEPMKRSINIWNIDNLSLCSEKCNCNEKTQREAYLVKIIILCDLSMLLGYLAHFINQYSTCNSPMGQTLTICTH